MRKHRITHNEAQQLLAGQALEGRSETAVLASSLQAFRDAAFATAPRPSVALAAQFGSLTGADISVATGGSSPHTVGTGSASSTPAPAPQKKGKKQMFAWIAGLGLAAKLTVGASTVALGLTGVGVAGAAGVLPGDVQAAFDDTVSVVLPVSDDEAVEDDAEVVEDDAEVVEDDAEAAEDAAEEAAEDAAEAAEAADDDADDVGDEFSDIDDEESGRAQEEQYRESDDSHDEADDVDEYSVYEDSGRVQEDSYRESHDAVEETEVVESDEVDVEQNDDSDGDSGSAPASGVEVSTGSESDAQAATTSGSRP